METVSIIGNDFEFDGKKYADIQPIGMGSFGLVCSALHLGLIITNLTNLATNTKVAIKKISKPFSSLVLAKRTFRELSLLIHLVHPNIISLNDVFLSSQNDVYFVSELLGTDLNRLLSSTMLEQQYIKYFTFQILSGLKYVHESGVIHRDLKPSNILVNENCEVKICDFGLARATEIQMTGYVATRYYRAPEIMLTWQMYDNKVDIWSVGCILSEMLHGKVLFPGTDHVNQFSVITEILGTPSDDVIKSICSENTIKFVQSLPKRERIPLTTRFPDSDPVAIDLMEKLLVFDPKTRITAEEALKHPYLTEHQDDEDVNVAQRYDWGILEQDLTLEMWKIRLLELIEKHKK